MELRDLAEHGGYAILVDDHCELYAHYPPDSQQSSTVGEYSNALLAATDSDWPVASNIRVSSVRINEQARWVEMEVTSARGIDWGLLGRTRRRGIVAASWWQSNDGVSGEQCQWE